jgi:hypothetical protein
VSGLCHLNLLSDAVHIGTDPYGDVSPRSIMYDAEKKKGGDGTTHISKAAWKHGRAIWRLRSAASSAPSVNAKTGGAAGVNVESLGDRLCLPAPKVHFDDAIRDDPDVLLSNKQRLKAKCAAKRSLSTAASVTLPLPLVCDASMRETTVAKRFSAYHQC